LSLSYSGGKEAGSLRVNSPTKAKTIRDVIISFPLDVAKAKMLPPEGRGEKFRFDLITNPG
jgi:hypothetical protein